MAFVVDEAMVSAAEKFDEKIVQLDRYLQSDSPTATCMQ